MLIKGFRYKNIKYSFGFCCFQKKESQSENYCTPIFNAPFSPIPIELWKLYQLLLKL